ncbi:MAG TPA: hypothetical protein VGH36_04810 [Acetobacteraceae bacterium]
MYTRDHWREDEVDEQVAGRQTASLAGIVVVLVLLIGGLFLVKQLRTETLIEDCIMSGRQNCDLLLAAQH